MSFLSAGAGLFGNISKAFSSASAIFLIAGFVAILSIPLNIVDLPVNLILLLIITFLNAFIATFVIISNMILAVAVNFPITLLEILMNFIIDSVNSVIRQVVESINDIRFVNIGRYSDYALATPDVPRVSLLSFDLLIKFTWDFVANPWNVTKGSFTITPVDSGLPDEGIWQIAIAPALKKVFDALNPFSKSEPSNTTSISSFSLGGFFG